MFTNVSGLVLAEQARIQASNPIQEDVNSKANFVKDALAVEPTRLARNISCGYPSKEQEEK